MINLARRIAAVESIASRSDNAALVAFMIDGASDVDVIAVRNMHGDQLERASGETLAELVARLKACQPQVETHVMFFEYSDKLRLRLGTKHLPDDLPETWPIPSYGHACHVEARP